MVNFYLQPQRLSNFSKSFLIIATILGLNTLAYTYSGPTSKLLTVFEAEQREFEFFLSKYQKTYSEKDYSKKAKKFRDNLGFIRKYNSMQSSVVLGANKFADLDFAEFSSLYLRPEQPVIHSFTDPDLSIDPLPDSIDWRTQNKVTPVKNQGHCGSCYSFAATGAIESAWAIHNNLSSNLPTFSEQQIMDCSQNFGNAGCGGGYAWTSFSYIIKNSGINSEIDYPYTGKNGVCNKTLELVHAATISSYKNVSAFNYIALKRAVSQQPVATSVEANILWHLYESGIMTQDCGYALNHAVLIVGYSSSDIPTWTVKNSWGTDWGLDGYIQIGMSPGIGVCGINTRPVYPII